MSKNTRTAGMQNAKQNKNGNGFKAGSESDRTWMSVREMGDLLGLRKTDRYWLVHKNVFETQTLYGKMRVNIESFEKWYANQVKYRKVTGEEPGAQLKEWSLSPRDISELLEIPEYRVYELIKEKNWETVTVDYWIRIRRDSFESWYRGQKHFRTAVDRKRDQEMEEATITFPQAAGLLGISRNQFYPILRDKRYAHFFELVELAGRRRITKESFQRFLVGQDDYKIATAEDTGDENSAKALFVLDEAIPVSPENSQNAEHTEPMYLTIAEAAGLAGISRQAVSRFALRGYFGECRQGGLIRIPKESFEAWMAARQKEVRSRGIN